MFVNGTWLEKSPLISLKMVWVFKQIPAASKLGFEEAWQCLCKVHAKVNACRSSMPLACIVKPIPTVAKPSNICAWCMQQANACKSSTLHACTIGKGFGAIQSQQKASCTCMCTYNGFLKHIDNKPSTRFEDASFIALTHSNKCMDWFPRGKSFSIFPSTCMQEHQNACKGIFI